MTFRGHARAIANDLPLPALGGAFDMTPDLSEEERVALERLGEAFATSGAIGPAWAHAALRRLIDPVDQALGWMRTPAATRCTARSDPPAPGRRASRSWR